MTLEEFVELIQDEDRIDELSDALFALEEDAEVLGKKHLEEEFDLGLMGPHDKAGNIATLEPPSIHQYIILPEGSELDLDYLDEISEFANDELKQVRRILDRFGSFLN